MNDLMGRFQALVDSGSIVAVPVAFALGVLATFTPCVYPLIPILMGYIGAVGDRSRWRAFRLSLLYVVGMAITFTVLGIVASLPGQYLGNVAQNPWMNLAVGALMIFFALALMGIVKIPMPRFLQGGGGKVRRGALGALLMGLSSGIISGTCTVAILAPLIGYLAAQGSVILGAMSLFAFAMGMGTLLLAAGTFSGLIKALPKPGPWLHRLEIAFGIAMIAIGLGYFILYKAVPQFAPSRAMPAVVSGQVTLGEGVVTATSFVGQAAPDFTAGDLQGKPVTLSDVVKEKPVLVVFWATWCVACIEEVPHLKQIYAGRDGRFEFIAVAVKNPMSTVTDFVRDNDVPYPVVFDPEGSILTAYAAPGMPFLTLVAKDGTIAYAGQRLDTLEKTLTELTGVHFEN